MNDVSNSFHQWANVVYSVYAVGELITSSLHLPTPDCFCLMTHHRYNPL